MNITLTFLNYWALGLLGIYLKYDLLNANWTTIARFLGKITPEELLWPERLHYYSQDIFFGLLIFPITLSLATVLLFRRKAVAVASIITVILTLLLFYQLQCRQQVGQYISLKLAIESAQWASENVMQAGTYVKAGAIMKLVVFIAALLGLTWVLNRYQQPSQQPVRTRHISGMLLAVGASSWIWFAFAAGEYEDSLLTRSSILQVATAYLASEDQDSEFASSSLQDILADFRLETHTIPASTTGITEGIAKTSNILLFVMETMPAGALNIATQGVNLPGVGSLLPHSVVLDQHYTSYPYTSDAIYSLLSGLYPQNRRRVVEHAGPENSLPALFSPFRRAGYLTAAYLPSLYLAEIDDRMFSVFGVESLYVARRDADSRERALADAAASALVDDLYSKHESAAIDQTEAARERGDLTVRVSDDLLALERMKSDIKSAIDGSRSFAMVYAPQLSHGPWPHVGDGDLMSRGRYLLLIQDMWLHEIVELLRVADQLDNTIIILTADHGLRTSGEDPSLRMGYLNPQAFHVPLLMFSTRAFSAPLVIDSPTSHIDVAPSVCYLAGVMSQCGGMQGLPVWEGSTSRRVFLFAQGYGGADGFTENGLFYMRNEISGIVYKNSEFTFPDDTVVARDDQSTIAFVSRVLKRMSSIQRAIASRILE